MRKLKKGFVMFAVCASLINGEFVQAVQESNVIQYNEETVSIIEQPLSQSYTAGQKVTAKVTAEGNGLKYQWQYKLPTDKGWINWRGTGANTSETSYNFPASFDGIKLRCVVTDGTGKSVTSGEATYTLAKALNITGQPENQSYIAGQKVTAKVTAEGSGLKYQWQYKLPTDKDWINWRGTGANTSETSYNFPASFDGIKLRCVVTDGTGKSITSKEATYSLLKGDDWELPIM